MVEQCVSTEGVEPVYIRTEILPDFFRNFWVRRMALDRRNYRQLVDTTVCIARKVRLIQSALPACAACWVQRPVVAGCQQQMLS